MALQKINSLKINTPDDKNRTQISCRVPFQGTVLVGKCHSFQSCQKLDSISITNSTLLYLTMCVHTHTHTHTCTYIASLDKGKFMLE